MAAMDRSVARGLLQIGTAVVVVNAVLLVVLYGPLAPRYGPIFDTPPDRLQIVLLPILAFTASVFGLWRMWRVWRGSH